MEFFSTMVKTVEGWNWAVSICSDENLTSEPLYNLTDCVYVQV
jgi:hypothetical protein